MDMEVHIPYSHSLKEKRQVLTRFKDRLRNQFNVSVAEVAYLEDWQRAGIALVMIGSNKAQLESQANAIEEFAHGIIDAELFGFSRDWL